MSLLRDTLVSTSFVASYEQFVCNVAGTIDEAKALIEAGFEHVCEFYAAKAFRKRK